MDADGGTPVEIAITVIAGKWPSAADMADLVREAVDAAYDVARVDGIPARDDYTVSFLFTDDAAIRALNRDWRDRDRATNVLSFPLRGPPPGMLGDIVLASETVRKEAVLEEKPMEHHIAHLIIHGFLHLFGYDHDNSNDAELMENLERAGLRKLGIADPYAAAVIKDD